MPGVTCTGEEPGIPAADVEFCLAGGNSGHSLSSGQQTRAVAGFSLC